MTGCKQKRNISTVRRQPSPIVNLLLILFHLFILSSILSGSEIQYLHPVPGSSRLDVNTPIIVRFWNINPDQMDNIPTFISVFTESGDPITGTTKIASDNHTFNFRPDAPYPDGQKINVRIHPVLNGAPSAKLDTAYSFTTLANTFLVHDAFTESTSSASSKSTQNELVPEIAASGNFQNPYVFSNGVSVPYDFPFVNISINSNPYQGNIFILSDAAVSYVLILNPSGQPVWYYRTGSTVLHPNVQPNGIFTFLESWYHFRGLNKQYGEIASYQINSNDGYKLDQHELLVEQNGNYLVIGGKSTIVDMSLIVPGGQPDAVVEETIVQELTPSRDILLEWRAWDHLDIRDLDVSLTDNHIEFTHMNSIAIDKDGNLLVSQRNLNEITKINRSTGDIIWRLGGKNNDFSFSGDPFNGFSRQHHIVVLGNGNFTLFDNGVKHSPQISRAVEYQINASSKTATLVWQYRNSPDIYSSSMGNVQRLPNGNTLINWALEGLPKLTEVTPSGAKVFEMDFQSAKRCYRVYKYDWAGVAYAPYLVAEPKLNYITLIFNKFGDSQVSYYNIYAKLENQSYSIIKTSDQPFAHLRSELPETGNYSFKVTAVSNGGKESSASNEVSLYHRIIEPGENMLINGDFSDEFYFWDWYLEQSAASATREITPDGVFHYNIAKGGSIEWHIACRQSYIRMLQGKTYRLEFDAWADAERTFEAEVRKNIDPFTNFSKIGLILLTPKKKHYSYQFIMKEPDETDARLCLNAGMSAADVYLDNISLIQVPDDSVLAPPVADFEASPVWGVAPLSVEFTDLSTDSVTSWSWDFGDGTASSLQHPNHSYETADTFTVSLKVTGPGGSDTITKPDFIRVIQPPPHASFSADTTRGLYPLDIQFTDLSTGSITEWFWDFGDGSASSEQHPSHTFATIDSFTVSLIVTGPGGADTLTLENYIITSGLKPTAGFHATVTKGYIPFETRFVDESTGDVSAWFWDFGDSTTSHDQHPVHTYLSCDTFSVMLIASGPSGADTLARPDYIIVMEEPPHAVFRADTTHGFPPFKVQFTDSSYGKISSWFWDFGDSATSHEQHPAHTYTSPDTFTVSLTVTGPGGVDMETKNAYIRVMELPPVADFIADTTQGLIPFKVHFSDQSTGHVKIWYWDFGDGQISIDRNPTHVYQKADTFTVTLLVSGDSGADKKTKTHYIVAKSLSRVDQHPDQIPNQFSLAQNYPNPFNAATKIEYALPGPSEVVLAVYNIRGVCIGELVNGRLEAGVYQVSFNMDQTGSGLYFYKIAAKNLDSGITFSETRKMIILR